MSGGPCSVCERGFFLDLCASRVLFSVNGINLDEGFPAYESFPIFFFRSRH